MDGSAAEKLLSAFSKLTGCGVSLIDKSGNIIFSAGSCDFDCRLLPFFSDGGICAECRKNACYGTERFGGRYACLCPAGMAFAVARINCVGSPLYIFAGPMRTAGIEEYAERLTSGAFKHKEVPVDALVEFARRIPEFPKEKADGVSELVSALAEHLGDGEDDGDRSERQREINDYIQGIRSRILLGIDRYNPYPYDKEKQLTRAIVSGNEQEAKKYLNELLGHIFFASADDLDAIKIRAMELTVVISRAALEGGADPNNIYNFNLQFVAEFFKLSSIEDVCFALTEILNKFTKETFGVSDAKHSALLSRATAFIKTNYMHKITLSDVAGHVYISPSYLSKLFREELNVTFSTYLNMIRTDKSKILLMSDKLSIIEVAELVGFIDQSYFNKVFKKLTGMTPKKFRRMSGADAVRSDHSRSDHLKAKPNISF